AIFKMHRGADVILVGHLAHWAIAATDIVVGPASRLGNGSLTDKDFLVAGDSCDGTSQHVGHINHVRHQVAQSPQAMLLLKAPGEETHGVSGIAVEKATVIMGQAS